MLGVYKVLWFPHIDVNCVKQLQYALHCNIRALFKALKHVAGVNSCETLFYRCMTGFAYQFALTIQKHIFFSLSLPKNILGGFGISRLHVIPPAADIVPSLFLAVLHSSYPVTWSMYLASSLNGCLK